LLGRIWTASRRASHGLQEDNACTLCSQAPETPARLLAFCVYSRELWFLVLRRHGMLHVLPSANVVECVDWWLPARKRIPKAFRNNFDTMSLLACWLIGLQRNTHVFGGAHARLRLPARALLQVPGGGHRLVVSWLPHAHRRYPVEAVVVLFALPVVLSYFVCFAALLFRRSVVVCISL
jgi:hypothetical protein